MIPVIDQLEIDGKVVVSFFIAEYPILPVSFDSYITDKHSLADLSMEKVKTFVQFANKNREMPITDDPLKVLSKFDLIKGN